MVRIYRGPICTKLSPRPTRFCYGKRQNDQLSLGRPTVFLHDNHPKGSKSDRATESVVNLLLIREKDELIQPFFFSKKKKKKQTAV